MTATVAKKIGLGFIKARRGDFNADFNNDFKGVKSPKVEETEKKGPEKKI